MHTITLFYSNRTPEDSAFLSELAELEKRNDHFHVINTITDPPSGITWTGEKGYIDGEMIKRHIPDVLAPIYFIAGPPAMVTAMQKVLQSLAVPESQVHIEEFIGY